VSVVGSLLRLRVHGRFQAVERVLRALPPVDRAAKAAYAGHKRRVLERATRDPVIRQAMLGHGDLPAPYGVGMDERVIEYPWVLARVPQGHARVFDAGSTLNYEWVARHPAMQGKEVVLFTLAPEGVLERRSHSYLYGDLRSIILQDHCVDLAVCISTLEHVGMDNQAYTGDPGDSHHDPTAYRQVLRELRRILRPGAQLLLTVPFGRRQDLGWLQQFDPDGIADIVASFGGRLVEGDYFRHDAATGWRRRPAAECLDAEFVHRTGDRRSMETRATAIACLQLAAPATA
jgi:hypothetical protein